MTAIFIKTYGCSLNQADSERLAALLSDAQFELVDCEEKADVVVINSCTVKKPTETKFFRYLNEKREQGKRIVVAGCIPQATPELLEGVSMIGTADIQEIVPVVEETLHGNAVTAVAGTHCERLSLPRIRRNKVIEIIPICDGCLGSCSYCIVKRARGSLRSYKVEDVLNTAKNALKEGAKELWLTAQDTGCYGKDIGVSLPDLLNRLTSLQGDFKIRIGMMNPEHVKGMLDKLIKAYESEKVFKFIHIPVQSGNDDILASMGRKYTVQEFKDSVTAVRRGIPDLTLSTDIICGFPSESDSQFKESVELVREIRPDVLNISRFWPRPKTPAVELEQLPGGKTKDRSRALTSAFEWISFENNKRWRKWKGKVLIDERGKDNTWVGRNFAYKPVIVRGDHSLGDEVQVTVTRTTIHDLRAE
jgi:threonylcarbamoyladenosine tRNA methylthiotransferase CDKAL1